MNSAKREFAKLTFLAPSPKLFQCRRGDRGNLMKERFKFRHVYLTGTFVLVLVAVLITAVILAGRSQRWFIGNVTLWIVLPEEGAEGKRHWLLRKYVNWTNPAPLRPLPGRDGRRKKPVKEFHSPKDSTR